MKIRLQYCLKYHQLYRRFRTHVFENQRFKFTPTLNKKILHKFLRCTVRDHPIRNFSCQFQLFYVSQPVNSYQKPKSTIDRLSATLGGHSIRHSHSNVAPSCLWSHHEGYVMLTFLSNSEKHLWIIKYIEITRYSPQKPRMRRIKNSFDHDWSLRQGQIWISSTN